MAVITFSKRQFEKDIGKFNEEMQNKIAMFGTPIEKIDTDNINIEIFPNRPDLLSYQGFKRSFLSFLGKKTGLKEYKFYEPEKDYKVIIDSSVKDVRPYTVCSIVKNLRLNDEKIKEIIDIQEKLHITIGRKRKKAAIGIYPLEEIQLPITFKALEPDKIKFIPLETERELSGLEILQRHPTGKEYAHLLAGKAKFPIFIDAKNKILSMPPIINSKLTGRVTESTRDVFVECSGSDLDTLKLCLNIIVTCLADMGGKVYKMEIKGLREKTPDFSTKTMKISLENTNKLLGTKFNEKEIKKLLEKMGYNYKDKVVEIPSWRADILHEVDLIEDIAIAYGYDNFIPEIPKISTMGEEDPNASIKEKISNILSGLGFLETSSYHLTNKKDQIEKMGLHEKEKDAIEIEESKTDYSILRKDLTPVLLNIFSENIDAEYPQKIFEVGRVFLIDKEKVIEEERLSCAVSPGNFTEIRQDIEYLFKMLNLKISVDEPKIKPTWFIEGRTAEILYKGKQIGFIGEIHPKILKNWKIKMPVALFEINFEEILKSLND